MILLLDIGNTNTHIGLASAGRIRRVLDVPTDAWAGRSAPATLGRFVGRIPIHGAALCSVVPAVTLRVIHAVTARWHVVPLALTHRTVRGLGIDYPKPATIGPDRLANAVAARHRYGAPVVVLDFGTAVTFDVVDQRGCYVGGIIAPGLAVMTDYLHEKTALLPRIRIREVSRAIGRSTEAAMRIGAVHGYRGMIHALLTELRCDLHCPRLPVVATGGYAKLIAARLPEITAVAPGLTLEGVLRVWSAHQRERSPSASRRDER